MCLIWPLLLLGENYILSKYFININRSKKKKTEKFDINFLLWRHWKEDSELWILMGSLLVPSTLSVPLRLSDPGGRHPFVVHK